MSEPISMNDFRKLIKSNGTAKTRNRVAGKASNVELSFGGSSSKENGSTTFTTPVSITFIHYRHRLADPDGISCKAAIDGLVACGILKDDSVKEVFEIKQRQVKIVASQEEKTEIIIEVEPKAKGILI